ATFRYSTTVCTDRSVLLGTELSQSTLSLPSRGSPEHLSQRRGFGELCAFFSSLPRALRALRGERRFAESVHRDAVGVRAVADARDAQLREARGRRCARSSHDIDR